MKKIISRLTLVLLFGFNCVNLFSQGGTCGTASPICLNDSMFNYPAGVGSGSAGSNVGCLYTTPNPAWYYFQVSSPGRINIQMWTTPSHDLDFACWGPFTANSFTDLQASGVCNQLLLNCNGCSSHGPSYGANSSNLGGYPVGNMTDCSYAADPIEYVHIPNAQTGQWYLLLITNYSNQACQINFQNHPTSTGASTCTVYRTFFGDTVCVGQTAQLSVDNPIAGATYTFQGPNGFFQDGPSSTVIIPNVELSHAGVYTVVIHPPTEDPSMPIPTTLVVHQLPDVITNSNSTVCENSILNLFSSGGTTYSWSGPNGFSSSLQNPTLIANLNAGGAYSVLVTDSNQCSSSVNININVQALPEITINTTLANCGVNNGTVSIIVNDTNYHYLWSENAGSQTTSTINNFAAGNYSVIIYDSVCSITKYVSISELGAPAIQINTQVTSICIGDTAVLTASGSSNYTWSGDSIIGGINDVEIAVNPTQSTLYTLLADSSGCVSHAQIQIIVNPRTELTYSPDVNVCIVSPFILQHVMPNGGIYSGEGILNNTFNPTQTGVSSIDVIYSYTNIHQCVSEVNYTIHVVPNPVVNCSDMSNILCQSASSFALTNGSPVGGIYHGNGVYSNNFYPSLSTLGQNIITYTFIDSNQCVSSCDFVINVQGRVYSGFSYVLNGRNIQITNQAVPDSIVPTYDMDNGEIIHQSSPSYTYPVNGVYYVKQTISNVCYSDSVVKIIDMSTVNIKEEDENRIVKLYPNPANNCLWIDIDSKTTYHLIQITNSLGQVVFSKFIDGENKLTIDVTPFSSGVYWVCLQNNESKIIKKILLTKER